MLFSWEKFLRSALYLGIIIQNINYVLNPRGGSFFAQQRTFALDRPLMAAGARPCYGKLYRREAGGTDDGQDFGNEILYADF